MASDYDELDRLVDTDPIALRDRAWELKTQLDEAEATVRAKVADEIRDMWADPWGRWTADQASAARRTKELIIAKIVRGGTDGN